MTKPTVYVTRQITPRPLEKLQQFCSVEINPLDRDLSPEELRRAVKGYTAILCQASDRIDAAVLDAADRCKIIANCAVGYNNIDVPAATARGIWISNTPGVLTDATADMAWSLLLGAARRIVEADHITRTAGFSHYGPLFMLSTQVTGKTLGIVGAGRIGQAVGERGKGFKMNLLYTANSPKPDFESATGAAFVALDTLLRQSDFISLHVPLTPQTRHLIGPRELSLMKPSAILVNTARGAVVDEAALVAALQQRQIAAAGLDVYEREPEITPGLTSLSNVVLAPHLGSATWETREAMATLAVDNILAALSNRRPPNCLNPEVTGRSF